MWKLFVFVAFLGAALADNDVDVQILDVKFLPFKGRDLSNLWKLPGNISRFTFSEQTAILNDYADDLIVNLNKYIADESYDLVDLPGFEESFKWTIFFGWVSLDFGRLYGMNTIQRSGDVILKYNKPNVKIHIPLGFSLLGFDYKYEAKFMGIGPSGIVEGFVKNCKFTVDLDIDMVRLRGALDKFQVNTLGVLSFYFYGGVLEDIVNVLIDVVKPILKWVIQNIIEDFVHNGLKTIINYGNNVVCGILNDCDQPVLNTLVNNVLIK